MSVDVSDLTGAIAKRRCAICGAQATVFSPGDDGERAVVRLPNKRPRADLNLCFRHALGIGWPWPSQDEHQRGSVA
jgi:hypothetical protein